MPQREMRVRVLVGLGVASIAIAMRVYGLSWLFDYDGYDEGVARNRTQDAVTKEADQFEQERGDGAKTNFYKSKPIQVIITLT